MKNKIEHTATPYKIIKQGSVYQLSNQNKTYNADAEFIVRACNSHDALVEALKEAKRLITERCDNTSDWTKDTLKQINKALSQAERG